MVNIYIYNIPKNILYKSVFFEECTSIFEIFHNTFIHNYTIVKNIEEADFAYIPFTFGSIFAITSFSIEKCENIWLNLYKPIIKHEFLDKIPHIIIWGYVLYHVNFKFIPSNIYIISLECGGEQSIVHNKDYIVVVPYILDIQTNKCCDKTTKIDCSRLNLLYEEKIEKTYDIGYIGRVTDENRNMIINSIETEFTLLKNIPSEVDPFDIYKKTKCALILRGDTPTRKAFFHALAAGSIPIIFESTLDEYDYIYFGMFESVRNIAICIPDSIDIDLSYLTNIKRIIRNALDNYSFDVDKFKDIFNRYNYYNTIDGYSIPVYHSVNSIIDKNKNKNKHL